MSSYWIEGLTILVSVATSWGATAAKIKRLEHEVEEFRKDHDLIIRLDTKVDGITDSIRELKSIIENKRQKR